MIVKFKVDIIAVSFIMFLIAPSAISKTSIVNDDLEVMKIKKIEQAITQNNISLLEKELEVTLDISKFDTKNPFPNLMIKAVNGNNLAIIEVLNDQCEPCAISNTGADIFNDLDFTSTPYSRLNAQTFRYIMQQGAGDSFVKKWPQKSLVRSVAGYWIPEPDGVYGDYVVTKEDKQQWSYRRKQKFEMLEYLFQHGYDINEMAGKEENTAISDATASNDEEMVDFLMANGVDPAVGLNPLLNISFHTSPSLIEKLISNGYSPLATWPTSTSVLGEGATIYMRLASVSSYKQEIMDLFDGFDIDVNAVDSNGLSALDYRAHEYGQADKPFINHLIKLGAVKSKRNEYSAFIKAIQDGEVETVREIIELYPEFVNGHSSQSQGEPLMKSVWAKRKDIFEMLLEFGAVINNNNQQGNFLLGAAISRAQYEVAEIILSHDVNVNRLVETNDVKKLISTSLSEVSSKGRLDWVEKFLALGASLDGAEFFSYPIVGAALNGHEQIVKRLLIEGAKVHLEINGKSLISLVAEGDNQNKQTIIDLLTLYAEKGKDN